MAVKNAGTGARGRRRLVPMMGIDFIAGNIESKKTPIKRGGNYPYGVRGASIGGRTRRWSDINFLQVNEAGANRAPLVASSETLQRRLNFKNATLSANATVINLSVLTLVQMDFLNGVVRQNVDPKQYATIRGWVTAVRMAQIVAGVDVTPTYTDWSWN